VSRNSRARPTPNTSTTTTAIKAGPIAQPLVSFSSSSQDAMFRPIRSIANGSSPSVRETASIATLEDAAGTSLRRP
jgi:hypothetical protein